ncbi:hypothetical protein QBC36DRAFT_139588 [Triangularia setosa]|uniref:DUF7580 domain-containing protein n=1 Tax=Triangularia setosa TaxID=2587417 RepID=A0AAN6W8C2_9PEZI|nr:hypothetical protein QBC36DRAFT_139588 [Podospora setosa]
MSGFEVAGIVLGSVPIVISALQLYVKGASTINRLRFATKELKSVTRNLQTEHIKLQNVYERLLADIVPESQIETMINNPFGPLWSAPETASRIQRRLWRSSKLFQEIVDDMHNAMDEIKQKLDIGPDGDVRWLKLSGVRKEYKRALFVLQRSEYQDVLSRLKDGISSLENLLEMNVELEPDRRSRSQGKVYKLLRDISGSIYQAIRSAVTCKCPGLHDFGLKLMTRPVTHLPYVDEDEEVLRTFKFCLTVSSTSTGFETEGTHWGSVKIWNLLSLSVSLPAHANPQDPADRLATGVRFLSLATADHNQNNSHQSAPPEKIENLCQSIRKSGKQLAGQCCGCIWDPSLPIPRTYQVYPLGSPKQDGDWSLVPLRSVLSGEVQSVSPLLYGDKLWLAWTIASSVAQLRGTDWYLNPPTHDDLYLARQGGVIHFREVFVVKRFPDQPISPPPPPIHPNSIHPTLVALGVLLIEVIFGQVLSQIRPMETDLHSILSSYEAVMQLLSTANTLGGPNYYKAVRKCIKCEVFDDGRMGGDEGHTDVFVEILNLLEQDLEMALS